MANFQELSEAHVQVLRADIETARQMARTCSKVQGMMWLLLDEAFGISCAEPDHAQVAQVTKVFAEFGARMAVANFRSHPGMGDPATLEFDSFPDRAQPNTILVRASYFFKAPVDRALTLLHHSVHLRFPQNPGDGHPGGRVAAYARGSLRIGFADAWRNPYCYEYFARFLPYL